MHLSNDQATAVIDEQGGRLASLTVDGLDLLVPETEKPTRWGSFPMIPWCGRLPFGVLMFDGRRFEMPPTSPPHANHGRTHLQLWHEQLGPEVRVEAGTAGTIRTELDEPWPFGGHALQHFLLEPGSLTVTAEVHAGDMVMPAMAGWHPWFRRQLDRGDEAKLRFSAKSIYETNDDDIPTGQLLPVPAGPWDACFVGLAADPVIEWPGALALTISSTFDHWVIFTEPDHALCVEPESGPPNEINGIPGRQPHLLQPGEALIGSMTLRWTDSPLD